MSMTYEDLQSLESEKKSQGFRNRLPPLPAFLQHLCSGPCPLLLTLGLILLLMIGIIVIGSKSARIQSDAETLRATFSNFTSNTKAEVQALHSQGARMQSDVETLRASFSNFTSNTEAQVQALHSQGGSLQATITSLKAVVENQEQELQAARSLNDKVFSLEIKLERQQQQLQAGYSVMLLRVQKFVHTLHCQVAALQSNDSQDVCCPIGWLEHDASCYWFSPFRLSWSEAQWSCQLQNAHLVVVGSQNEQKFLEQHMYPVDTWIGLTDQHGPWTWVDGTDYKTGFQNWSPGQPDNWYYHGQEDCAHLRTDGQWNDNVCMTPFCWVCETELNRTSS